MTSCILRSFIVKKLNKLLDEYKENVCKARGTVNLWLTRANDIVKCLESLSAKLEDNKLTDEELEQAIEEIQALVKGWK